MSIPIWIHGLLAKTQNNISWKEGIFINFNIEGITDTKYNYAKIVWKYCKLRILGNNYSKYIYSNTLLPLDIVEHISNRCMRIFDMT